ncbi:MAG: GNAT family N-acetyltransferase [Micrococcales bacterium]|nr:GNAT family N-acetyltransferase [Micrococcales bacterium]
MSRLWLATLERGHVRLRPINNHDRQAWQAVRARNVDWLRPWDATLPPGASDAATTFRGMVRALRTSARAGTTMPFALDVDGAFCGQVTVGSIHFGSLRGGHIGYWIDRAAAGSGVMPMAVAMTTDHCFASGLHRIEINIRPENGPSIRVEEKVGFRYEGLRERYLHIDGDWRDHVSYALTVEEVNEPLADRFARLYGEPKGINPRTRRSNPGSGGGRTVG